MKIYKKKSDFSLKENFAWEGLVMNLFLKN
jgi:hypothetical protein